MWSRWAYGLCGVVVVGTACSSGSAQQTSGSAQQTSGSAQQTSAPSTTRPATAISTPTTSGQAGGPIRIAVTVERRVNDPATEGFAAVVRATLTDPRGWQGAGFEFGFADGAPYTIVLAEGPEVDRLCRPYDVGGRFSCQNGPVVALNAERWRTATPQWTGDLDSYRRMLVNHEVGHLLGQHHPRLQCPHQGQPAPVMAQQSTELDGCLPNPWPRPWELACAARHHDEPIAPGYDARAASRCEPGP
ncbi:MAG: hypothetical protein QOE80_3763 [Actinomycetota bacterium]|nr:hypothetical protein [Actinomycetota bacterium]